MPDIEAHTRVIAAFAGLALFGCMTPTEMPELAEIPDRPPPGFERSVEATIEEALPRVSYSPDSPDYLGPLVHAARASSRSIDREFVRGMIRQLEALDGEAKVVCISNPESIFGYCNFPTHGEAPDLETNYLGTQ